MKALARIFTWWNGATIGTALWSRRNGTGIGTDALGNAYFEGGKDVHGNARRWVIYEGANDASRVPPEWFGWLHHTTDLVPEALPPARTWEAPSLPNLTGTPAAYRPAGAIERGGDRAAATGDYEAWSPLGMMKSALKENAGEALVGLLVVLLAIWFVVFAWGKTGGGSKAGGTTLTAMFPSAGGVNVGTDVRVAGLKVGSVSELKLDPKSYQVAVRLKLNPGVQLPSDSSAAVASEGLLGGTYIGMTPGGSETMLKSGDTITDTQGSMDLMALIGQFINKPASDSSSAGAAPKP